MSSTNYPEDRFVFIVVSEGGQCREALFRVCGIWRKAPERLSDTSFSRPFLVFLSGREAVATPSAPEACPELICVFHLCHLVPLSCGGSLQ